MGTHFTTVVDGILEGRVVPFLGAGVNLCDRPEEPENQKEQADSQDREPGGRAEPAEEKKFRWTDEQSVYPPSGAELAEYLAKEFRYPVDPPCPACTKRPALDLARVSEFGGLDRGPGVLNEKLHALFVKQYPATSVHQALTSLPMPAPKAQRPDDRYPLFATTNYDDLMERAFPAAQELDIVFYDPDDQPRGRFWHKPPGKNPLPIEQPNEYDYPFCTHRPAILKLHGTVDRATRDHEGFVITEDHYIEYLAEEALEKLLPSALLDKLRNNHLLFLGYSLKDWNFRVFLRRLKRSPRTRRNSWAIMLKPDETDEKFWAENRVEIRTLSLADYMNALLSELWSR